MQIEVFRVSRKSSVLPVVAALAGLCLTGCEHPDGIALVTASATAGVRTTSNPSPTTSPPGTTTTTTSTPTTTEPPATTTTTTVVTTTRPPASRPPAVRPTPPAQTTPPAPAKTDVESAEAEVVELTNAERARNGCPALAADDRLAAAARAHSADMAAQNYFDHVSKDGRSFVDRVKAAGHPKPGAENIAAGQRTADDVVKGWMESPGHRANILNCKLKTLGAGMARGGSYGIYWTQNFGW